ncbi:hypothetical protein BH11PSE2_BH11PSE2_13310 [soil metagenome]
MRPPLTLDLRRMSLAALFGVIVPPTLFVAGAFAFMPIADPHSLDHLDLNSVILPLFTALRIMVVIFGVFGIPAWTCLHFLRATAAWAVSCGTLIGIGVGAVLGGLFNSFANPQESAIALVGAFLGLSLAGAAIGALTAFGVWTLAYGRPHQPQAGPSGTPSAAGS